MERTKNLLRLLGVMGVLAMAGGCEHDTALWGSPARDLGTGVADMTPLTCEDPMASTHWDNATFNTDGSVDIDAWGVVFRLPHWPYDLTIPSFYVGAPTVLHLHNNPSRPQVATNAGTTHKSLPAALRYIKDHSVSNIFQVRAAVIDALLDASDITVTPKPRSMGETPGSRVPNLLGMWLGGTDRLVGEQVALNRLVTVTASTNVPGSSTYGYRVVTSMGDPTRDPFLGIVGKEATVLAMDNLNGNNAVHLSWSAVPALPGETVKYSIYRTSSITSVYHTGLLAITTATSFTDDGTKMLDPNKLIYPAYSSGPAAPVNIWTFRTGIPGKRVIRGRYATEAEFTEYAHLGAFVLDLSARAAAISDGPYTVRQALDFMDPVAADVCDYFPPFGQ